MSTTPKLVRSQPFLQLLARQEQELSILRRRAPHSDACIVLSQNTEELRDAMRDATSKEELYLTLEEAAAKLGIEPVALRRLARLGRVPGARKIAGEWRIPVSYIGGHVDDTKEAA